MLSGNIIPITRRNKMQTKLQKRQNALILEKLRLEEWTKKNYPEKIQICKKTIDNLEKKIGY